MQLNLASSRFNAADLSEMATQPLLTLAVKNRDIIDYY